MSVGGPACYDVMATLIGLQWFRSAAAAANVGAAEFWTKTTRPDLCQSRQQCAAGSLIYLYRHSSVDFFAILSFSRLLYRSVLSILDFVHFNSATPYTIRFAYNTAQTVASTNRRKSGKMQRLNLAYTCSFLINCISKCNARCIKAS